MDKTIKALPSTYGGITYRSRAEARWARFFDLAGIEFMYEPEGYDIRGEWYVPDFYLPKADGGMWWEVKPGPPTEKEDRLAQRLSRAQGKGFAIACGPPGQDTEIIHYGRKYRLQCWVKTGDGLPMLHGHGHHTYLRGTQSDLHEIRDNEDLEGAAALQFDRAGVAIMPERRVVYPTERPLFGWQGERRVVKPKDSFGTRRVLGQRRPWE
jgi:hypothetical protein